MGSAVLVARISISAVQEGKTIQSKRGQTMNRSGWKTWCSAFLSVALISLPGTPLRSQQGPCATQIGPKMPDLIVDAALLRSQMFLSTENYGGNTCTVQEGCVSGPGKLLLPLFNGPTPKLRNSALLFRHPRLCSPPFSFPP